MGELFDSLAEETQEDLIAWYNEVDPCDETKEKLANLSINKRFKAWDCPECGDKVYHALIYDFSDYQGVLEQDFASYPGNLVENKFTDDYLRKMCDHCRMTK